MASIITLTGFLGAMLVVVLCRQPNVRFYSLVTVFNRKTKLTEAGAKLYVVFLIIAAIGAALTVFRGISSPASAALPACNAEETQKLLKDAFDQSQFARNENLSLVEVTNITDTTGANKTKRMCTGTITMNNTETGPIKYELEAREGGKVMLTVEAGEQEEAEPESPGTAATSQANVDNEKESGAVPVEAETMVAAPPVHEQQVMQAVEPPAQPGGVAATGAVPDIIASFDCAKASSRIEKLICSDAATADADSQLAVTYREALSRSADKAALKQSQRNWLSQTRNACGDTECLTRVTEERIQALVRIH
jgi:uncharacterized protein YecT (DUF1311 family)